MPSCVLRYCSNHSRKLNKSQGVTFHRFPRPDHEKREEWIKFVQTNRSEETWLPSDHTHICSVHFKDDDKYTTKTGRVYLKKSAVPCNNPKKTGISGPVVSEPLFASADQAQNQESGGGEGIPVMQVQQQAPAQTVEEIKSVEPVVEQPKALQEQQTEAKISDVKTEVLPAQETIFVKLEPSSPAGVETIEDNQSVNQNEDWQQREQELLKKIEDLGKVKNEKTEDGFKLELKVREEEIDLLKARVKNLETELQAALSKPNGKNHEMIENIKQQHEELLSKARGMIFDKTKMVKNQELQIEALTTQVQSLKDINQITKDLLEIRNSEVKAMEERLQAMEARFKAEKDRYGLVLERAQTSSNINDDLRKEYETQLALFKELREKYEQRVQALMAENTRLKESVQGGTSG